ncbi:uncharacterized protein LOC130906750 isoform X2 [Corythoichthys intestinalis]|uniref:uncharacterized protein LOC130906750 isoform X2 n=1 Tax=Corythoichthys intestinalis TaxID=161448 RepID=UPI0025A50F0C|nr:uncharacterized protein LOC130906750 isoform X2 [Corythoichthys intestinalis]
MRCHRVNADTPFKVPLLRRHARGVSSFKKKEEIPEEGTEGNSSTANGHLQNSSRPSQPKPHFHPSSTKTILPITASSAEQVTWGQPACQVRSNPVQTGLTVTAADNSSDSSDDDVFCDSEASTSLSSPEIFRNDQTGMFNISLMDPNELVDVQKTWVRNSTLVNSDHKSINMYQTINLSTILDTTSVMVNTNNKKSEQEPSVDDSQSCSDKSSKGKPLKPANARRPISYRKLATFKNDPVAKQGAPKPCKEQDSEENGEVMFFHFDSSSRMEFFKEYRKRYSQLAVWHFEPSVPLC